MTYASNNQPRDVVVPLNSVPRPAIDASEPFVVANERRVAVAYRIEEAEFERFGPFVEGDDPYTVVLFSEAAFHQFGPPNDDDLDAHPLAQHGLRRYSAHEIEHSSFVSGSWGQSASTEGWRHFVLTFQDSTYECVATDCTMVGIYGNADIARREAFSLCG